MTGFQEEIDRVKTQIRVLSLTKLSDLSQVQQLYLEKDQLTIIDFIDQIGRITTSDVVDILHVPKRTAQAKLAKLKSLGIIVQLGKGRASAYALKK